jgi:uroporphyrinogen decarboxylase
MCEKMHEEFPDHYVTTAIGGPWTFATELRGASEALMDLYDDKKFLFDLMEYTTETVIVRCIAPIELGIDIFLADPSAGMSLISPAVYMEHVRPYHQRVIKAIHEKGGRVCLHICGHVDPIFGELLDLGVDALSIDAPSSLEKLFEVGRGNTLIIGNVDPVLFTKESATDVEAAAQKCLDIAKGDAKYAIGPGCQLPSQADVEIIKAFIRYCHEHGTFS